MHAPCALCLFADPIPNSSMLVFPNSTAEVYSRYFNLTPKFESSS
jgi:hypothetical protein